MKLCSLIDGATIRRNWSPNIQRYQCVESWTETPYTSMRTRRTQNSYFESFTQQTSSVSTEQCLTGVKRIRSKTERSRLQQSLRRQSKRWRKWDQEKWILLSKLQEMTGRHQETDCEIWKIWKTGYGNQIRKSLWRSSVLGISLCGYAIQNCPRRWWWFWRSNTSMQRIHISSRTSKFLSLRSDPRKYDNWTSSSSSHGKISWQLWSRNSDSFHGYSRSNLLGNYVPRKEPISGECISPRSRTNQRVLICL